MDCFYSDVIYKILTFIPLENLVVLIFINKQWKKIIDENFKKRKRGIIDYFAEEGNMEMIIWLREKNIHFQPDSYTCAKAAKSGCLDILKYIRKYSTSICLFDTRYSEHAAKNGDLEMLKWLRGQNCLMNDWTCAYAAEGGYIEILDWLWTRIPRHYWNTLCSSLAAKNGQLEALKWLRNRNCPMDVDTKNLII